MGWAIRDHLGLEPILTPMGTHTSVATMTRTMTRLSVMSPSHSGVQNTAQPFSAVT